MNKPEWKIKIEPPNQERESLDLLTESEDIRKFDYAGKFISYLARNPEVLSRVLEALSGDSWLWSETLFLTAILACVRENFGSYKENGRV